MCTLVTYGHKGSTVTEDLSTWKHCPSGRLTFHPVFRSTTATSERTFLWRERPCLYQIPNPPHPTLSLDGEKRNAAHTDPSLMACHGGHKCPAVRLWVIHLHRA